VLLVRCDSPLGSAIDDASDRLLHSETTETRVPVASSFPGAAVTRVCLSATPVDALVPRLAPRAHSNGVAPCADLPSEDERAGTEGLGPLDASETGEDRVSRRDLHFGDPFDAACGVDSSARRPSDPPLTSLSPPPWLKLVESTMRSMREHEGRQDRFRGGLVKGVRFSDPRCLPSLGATQRPSCRSTNGLWSLRRNAAFT
jgi:hypothetical protein